MKRALLLLLLTASFLLLTACYTEVDPWPDASLSSTPIPVPVVTDLPATEVPSTGVPSTPQRTEQPAPAEEPLQEDAVDVSPNFNG